MGSIQECKKTGAMIVQGDYRIATAADIVADPSAPGAFVQGIMENVEWIYDSVNDSWLEEKLSNTKKSIHNMSMSQLEESKLSIFEDYISTISVKK